ncbi:unnamed protein product [Closterium sp. NIES-64]|nr:unnamed protein product [Closterium sp. NIES-64]
MAHSMEFTEKEDLSKLHLVLELDKKRNGCCMHAMQKFRSDVWLIVRAFFRIFNGLKYTKPPTTEQPLLKKTVLKKSGPQNGTTVEWYHHRLKAWAKHAIIERTPEHGPWWKAKRKAWAFKRHALVLISDDGLFLAPLREAESRDE